LNISGFHLSLLCEGIKRKQFEGSRKFLVIIVAYIISSYWICYPSDRWTLAVYRSPPFAVHIGGLRVCLVL